MDPGSVTPEAYMAVKAHPRGTPSTIAHEPLRQQPPISLKAKTARWLMHEVDWGTFAMSSTLVNGETFIRLVSLADGATGTPYFLVSPKDVSLNQDVKTYP